MDAATIRRYLSGPRLTVLEIVEAGGARDAHDIARSWLERRPSLPPAHARLPRIAGQLLWQLASLEWIERSHGTWAVSDLGRCVRELRPAVI